MFLTAHVQQRLWTWLVWGNMGVALLVAGGSLGHYFQQRLWQNLALLPLALAALLLLGWVRRFTFAAPVRVAYGLLAAYVLVYGGATAFFQGTTGYTWFTVALLLLGGALCRSGRWEVWLGSGLGAAGIIGLLEVWAPLPRLAMSTQPPVLSAALFGGGVVYLVALLWAGGHWVGGLSIRARLLLVSLVSVLLTVLSVSAVSVWLGWRSVQRHVLDRLELTANLRESQIDVWVDRLETELNLVLTNNNVNEFSQYILPRYVDVAATEPVTIPVVLTSSLETYLATARRQSSVFQELLILNVQGEVVASDNTQQRRRNYASERFFTDGRQGFSVNWALGSQPFIWVSMPIFSTDVLHTPSGAPVPSVGVLAGRVGFDVLNEIMTDRAGLGETGVIYLVGSDYLILSDSRGGTFGLVARTPGIAEAIDWERSGSGFYVNEMGVPLVEVYHWLPRIAAVLSVQQAQSEAFRELYITILLNGGIAFFALLLSVGLTLLITRSIVQPLLELTNTASEVAAGNLTRVVRVARQDEIGRLGLAFNSMTEQLRGAFRGLEQRVAERTHDLQRRSRYLEASSEVGRAVSSILNIEQLIRDVVGLILERFDLYYVGLFLISGDSAVLRAGTGEAGQAMLARGHRIRIGEGMVGWSIAHNQARIASKAEADAVRLTNPELPNTRSEAALPLRSRGQVLGALSVQSTVSNAFDEDTISVLQTMTDLVAASIDNARLFAEAQEALEAERRAYGQHTREMWMTLMRTNKLWNYAYVRDAGGEAPSLIAAQGGWDAQMRQVYQTNIPLATLSDASASLTMPLRTSGQVVGVLRFERTGAEVAWTDEEMTLLGTLTDQLGQTLERAQLYLETQQRAMRDRLVANLAARMRESLDIDTVLRTTVREIFDTMNFASVEVRLGGASEAGETEAEVTW